MDTILQISEIVGLNYPEYFKIFMDNCLRNYSHTFRASDYLFAAIYFLILDSGFCTFDLYDEYPQFCTKSFDIRKMRVVKCYRNSHVRVWRGLRRLYMAYKIPVRYGPYSAEVEIQAVPSAQNHNYLIVNMFKRHSGMIKSLCINMSDYLRRNRDGKYKYILVNTRELEILIKDEMCNPIRETIMLSEDPGCCATLLRLPEFLQSDLMYIMRGSPMDIQFLSSTCSYFYRLTRFDSYLWQELCSADYTPKGISRALAELFQFGSNESTIFKQAFLEMKKREQKKLAKSYKSW